MKLQYKLSSIIFVFGIIILVLLSLAYYFYMRSATIDDLHFQVQKGALERAEHVEVLLREKIARVEVFADIPLLKKTLMESNAEFKGLERAKREILIKELNERWMATDDPADLFVSSYMTNPVATHLTAQVRKHPEEYGELFLTNRYGSLVATTGKLTTLAHGHKYWWVAAYNRGLGKVFIDDRGFDKSVGEHVIGVTVPMMEERSVAGILKFNLKIDDLMDSIILGHRFVEESAIMAVRSGGLILAAEGVDPLKETVAPAIVEAMAGKRSGSIIIREGGKKALYGYAPVSITLGSSEFGFGGSHESIDHILGNKGESWYILTRYDLTGVLSFYTEERFILTIGGLTILLTALLAMLIGKRFASPIVEMKEMASRVGRGDFDARVDNASSDEIGSLADSLNRMTAQLRATTVSKNYLNGIINSMSEAVLVLDMDMKITKASVGAMRLIDYSEKELVGESIDLLFPPDGQVTEMLEESLAKREPLSDIEKELLRRDETKIPVLFSSSILKGSAGEAESIVCVAHDLTAIRLTEEAIRESEESYRGLTESLAELVYRADPETLIATYVSSAIVTIYGYTANEWLDDPDLWEKTLHPDDREKVIRNMENARKELKNVTIEYRIVRKDGGAHWVEDRVSWEIGTDGKPISMTGVMYDITENKEAEKALRKRTHDLGERVKEQHGLYAALKIMDDPAVSYEETMQAVVEILPPAWQYPDITRARITLNEASFETEGFKDTEWMQSAVISAGEEDIGRVEVAYLEARESSGSGGGPFLKEERDLIEALAAEIGNYVERCRAIEELRRMNDILEERVTERTAELKKTQDELVRKEKLAAVGQLGGHIAHDLRNPLGTISNSIYFLNMKLKDADEKVRKHIKILEREIRTSERMISDMLDFYRVKPPVFELCDINGIISDQLDSYSFPDSVTVERSLAEGLPRVNVDPDQIRRVMLNLVDNGVGAMTEGGAMKIKSMLSGGTIEVTVTDSGSGVAKENLERIFEPLFTTKPKGIGLGLSIVKDLAEKNSATVECESEVGRGTSFTLHFAIARKEDLSTHR